MNRSASKWGFLARQALSLVALTSSSSSQGEQNGDRTLRFSPVGTAGKFEIIVRRQCACFLMNLHHSLPGRSQH